MWYPQVAGSVLMLDTLIWTKCYETTNDLLLLKHNVMCNDLCGEVKQYIDVPSYAKIDLNWRIHINLEFEAHLCS